jgi:3-phosphoshikimate 1-carboxyvinyltransferase
MSDSIQLKKAKKLKGIITPPPDKSITHRAIILSSISKGKSRIKNFLDSEDTMSTLNAFRMLGIDIKKKNNELIVEGKGLHGLSEPENVIDCKNSGTTIRLVSGILSGNPFLSVLTGDESLRTRPMRRVILPLQKMGADIKGRAQDTLPPIIIKGNKLNAITYTMPIASAQIKSAILFAGLYADGETEVIEPMKSRDHTERMLPFYGAKLQINNLNVRIKGAAELKPSDISVPGDFSSAAFFIVAGVLIKNSNLKIKNVGINQTRTGLIGVLKSMGADIKFLNKKEISGEPVADIHCKQTTGLKAVTIDKKMIPGLIDEFPIICIAASQADGITTIRGAEELRVKESDRIKAMANGLKKMGVEVEEHNDGLIIKGNSALKGDIIDSHGDHRIAMAFSVAALIAQGTTTIKGTSAVNISFPGFFKILKQLTK